MIIFVSLPKNINIPIEDFFKFVSICCFIFGITILSVSLYFHHFPTKIQVENNKLQEMITNDRINREKHHQELIEKYGKNIWKRG
jgi:hypothetical protein